MANSKGKGPRAMDPKVVKRLLDKLTTDDAFRAHFQRDAQSALESIGYVAPAEDAEEASAGTCLQLQAGSTLASPEDIASARPKLESSLAAIHGFMAPNELQSL
jgi:putative modified peptide